MPVRPTDLILVAVINNPRDLEIARVLGWYRIPCKSAPKVLLVDWLAFYQTAAFGEEKWAIHHVAPVRGHELATRAELLRTEPDHPRASDPYYKIQIGPLERLSQPIPARQWRRITFLYTIGENLLAASELSDLVVRSEERRLLWQTLRERSQSATPASSVAPGDEIDLTILCALGTLGVAFGAQTGFRERPGWEYLAVPETAADPAALPGALERAVQQLGGLDEE